MGLLDFGSTVLTTFKSDTRDMEQGLKKLNGLEKEQQEQLLSTAKARNAGYDEWLGRLARANQALELGGKVIGFLGDAWKEYADDIKLAAAVGSTNIDKLRQASLGLRTEQELMEFAAKASNGQIKASQEQMETAQRAMVALTRAGFDQKEVTDKVTSAMVSLKTRGLESLGVTIKDGKTDLETFNNLMSALGQKALGVDSSSLTASEGIQKMGVSMSDSFDNMKSALGSLVQAMAPLLEALAAAVGLIADITVASTQEVNWIDAANKKLGIKAITRDKDVNVAELLGLESPGGQGARQPIRTRDRWDDADAFASGSRVDEGTLFTWSNGVLKKLPGKAKPGASKFSDYASVTGTDTVGAPIGFGSQMYGSLADTAQRDEYGREIQISTDELLGGKTKALTDDWMRRVEEQRSDRVNFLEATFGKPEEINVYAQAFGAFTAAVGSAYEAIVTGSGSASVAFKRMIADSIMGIGKQSAIEAIKHAAMAIGSAASYNYPAAAMHTAAAAKHALVAVAAGVAAHAIGPNASAGQSSASADTVKTGGAPSGSMGNGGGGAGVNRDASRPIYVILGDHFDDYSMRQRQQKIDEQVDKAMRDRDE